MDDYTSDELQEALRPIASLTSKSQKAQQRLAPGTWQHSMLEDNLKALRIATGLMTDDSVKNDVGPDELRDALRALESMIDRSEKAMSQFAPGTSQHSLQRNRLKALRIAAALTEAQLERD